MDAENARFSGILKNLSLPEKMCVVSSQYHSTHAGINGIGPPVYEPQGQTCIGYGQLGFSVM